MRNLILLTPEIALAAVAASAAFFAAVVGTRVLGAVNANPGRRLAADAARESGSLCHSCGVFFFV